MTVREALRMTVPETLRMTVPEATGADEGRKNNQNRPERSIEKERNYFKTASKT